MLTFEVRQVSRQAIAEHGRHAVRGFRTARNTIYLVLGIFRTALAQADRYELAALEQLLAGEMRLELRRGDLGTEARGFALVGR